jgi:predicted RNA binding protein YcfA (HicA-like mRNA interferase family)
MGLKVRDLIRALESNGWRLSRTRGSHRQFRHPEKGLIVTEAGQPGSDVPAGTLKAILRSAGLESRPEDR